MTSDPLEHPKPTPPVPDDAPATAASRAYAKAQRPSHGPMKPSKGQAAALMLRSERAKTKHAHNRGLKALDEMSVHLDAFYRWRTIAALAPSAALIREAAEARDYHSRRAGEYLSVVQAALGRSDDEAAPVRHWDKGAMEE